MSPSEDTNARETGAWTEPVKKASNASLVWAMDKKVAGGVMADNSFTSLPDGMSHQDSSFDVVFKDTSELPEVFTPADEEATHSVDFRQSSEKLSQGDLSFDILFEDSQDNGKISRRSSQEEDDSSESVNEDSQNASKVSRYDQHSRNDSFDIVFEDSHASSRECGKVLGHSDRTSKKGSNGLWNTNSDWSSTCRSSEKSATVDSDIERSGYNNSSVEDNDDDSIVFEDSKSENAGGFKSNDNDSIVFEDSKSVNTGSFRSSSVSVHSNTSHPPTNRSKSHECSSGHLAVPKSKRRRVQSQPQARWERPTSLSLTDTSISKSVPKNSMAGIRVNNSSPSAIEKSKPCRTSQDKSAGKGKEDDRENKENEKVVVGKTSNPRTFLYIQMELCRKESLRDWLMRNQTRHQDEVLRIFNDIVKAVEYVHDNHLMHRDLKVSQ